MWEVAAVRGILMAFLFAMEANLDFCLAEDKAEFQHVKDSHAWLKLCKLR